MAGSDRFVDESPAEEPPGVRFGILGELEVVDARGRQVRSPSPRAGQVLAVLCLARGEVVSADRLIEVVWGADVPRDAANALQGHVSALRRALGRELIETVRPGYRLAVSPEQIDAVLFDRLVEEAASVAGRAPDAAIGRLEQALALWRGVPLPGLDSPVVTAQVTRLTERRRRAITVLADCLVTVGRAGDAVPLVVAELDQDPIDETLAGVALHVLAGAGRRVDALRAAQVHRRALSDAGLEPGVAFLESEAAVARSGGPAATAVRRVPPPFYGDPFVGRAPQLEQLRRAVREHRLTTLTGPGGVGKSRLAREFATDHGSWWCDVGSAPEGADIAALICAALRIRPIPGGAASDALCDVLGPSEGVLVLDDTERAAPEVAHIVGRLLASGEHLRVVTTGRSPLAVAGEHVMAIPPLPLRGEGSAAQLFAARAAQHAPGVAPDDDVTDAIVGQLDGMPLALELAAGRLAVIDPGELLAHLRHDVTHLRRSDPARPARHQSLEACVLDSWRDLRDPLRAVLTSLAAFNGPFALADAASVAGLDARDCAGALDDLRRASLIQVDHGRTSRFHLLRPVRDVVWDLAEQSGGAARLEDAHSRWLLRQLADARAAWRGPDERRAVERATSLRNEVAAVIARGGATLVLPAIAELFSFQPSAEDGRALRRAVDDGTTDAWILAGAAQAALVVGDPATTAALCERGRGASGPGEVPWLISWVEGGIDLFVGRFRTARLQYEAAARQTDDPWARAFFTAGAAHAGLYAGDADAHAPCVAALDAAEHLGNPSCLAFALVAMGTALVDDDRELARTRLSAAQDHAAAVGNQVMLEAARLRAAEARADSPREAARSLVRALDGYAVRGNRAHAAEIVARALPLLAAHGDLRSVVVLHAAIRNAPGGAMRLPAEHRQVTDAVAAARTGLGSGRYDDLCEEGAALRFDDLVDLARERLVLLSGV